MKKYNLNNYKIVANCKIGKWTLSTKLGVGGNGSVWKCRDSEKKEYAIKFLRWGRGDSYKRFRDEILCLEKYADVEGILPVVDKNLPSRWSQYDYKLPLFYVMPLGLPVDEMIKSTQLNDKIAIVDDLLRMLINLHEREIAHRDIKPANILLYNGHYVFSDFGLAYFIKKPRYTPQNGKLGARWTMSPQMERNAVDADPYKSDVYSMAKTIWMIFTGELTGFEGQYIPSSDIGLTKFYPKIFWGPLDHLLEVCTDHSENVRPDAKTMRELFLSWKRTLDDWHEKNMQEWLAIQRRLFPTIIPNHVEWHNIGDIISVLKTVGSYKSLNYCFFPDGGGLELTDATYSHELMCVELHCGGLIYIVKPFRLSFDSIDDNGIWNYFTLETFPIDTITPDYPKVYYSEQVTEYGFLDYRDGSIYDYLSKEEIEQNKARRVVRYLKGTFVIFMKDSIYNQLLCDNKGEHEKLGTKEFKNKIEVCANKFNGLTMKEIIEKANKAQNQA